MAIWEVGKVWNELVRGESGWISFAERDVKFIVDWMLMIVYEERLVSDIGRACLMEVEYRSRWWARCNHMCKFGLWEMLNLLWLRNINKDGMAMLEMKYDNQKNEKYANGGVGARVRLMVRGGCLPVSGSIKGMEWKYDDGLCVCGTKETDPCAF